MPSAGKGTRCKKKKSLLSHYHYYYTGRPDFICNQLISSASVDIFSPMTTLMKMFDCRETMTSLNRFLYTLTFDNRTETLAEWQEVRNTVVADWLEEGISMPQISVCRSNYPRKTCNLNSIPQILDLGNVTILVTHNTERLFPYDNLTSDRSFHGVTDGVVEIRSSTEIPFFQGYYRSIHVSNNLAIGKSIQ